MIMIKEGVPFSSNPRGHILMTLGAVHAPRNRDYCILAGALQVKWI
jgi:hypothetical protein